MIVYEKSRLNPEKSFAQTILKTESFPLHYHRDYELIFVESGELDLKVEGQAHLLKKGDSAIIFPNQYHEYLSNRGNVLIRFFQPELVPEFNRLCENKIPVNCVFKIAKLQDNYINSMDNICFIKSYLYNICGHILQQIEFKESNKNIINHNLLRNIITYVEENYINNCSLIALANELGYDYAYLSKFFKKHTGTNFIEYVHQIRIKHACSLLESTNMNISDISTHIGYNSIKSFNRNFLKETGKTPKAYRISSTQQSI